MLRVSAPLPALQTRHWVRLKLKLDVIMRLRPAKYLVADSFCNQVYISTQILKKTIFVLWKMI